MSYSLWLSMPPGCAVRQQLAREIGRQADAHAAPRFEPHVTLLGGIDGQPDAISATAAQLAARIKQPLRLNFLDVSTGPSFHRCVYLLVAKEPALMEAGAAARQAFDLAAAQPPGEFMPHCSLLYAQLDAQARAAAAAGVVARLYGEGADYGTLLTDAGCTCDALTLWYTPADDTSLASWSQVAEFKLGGGGAQGKKVAIPGQQVELRSLAWNTESGWVACGGDNALLKVFRLEGGRQEAAAADGPAAGAAAAGAAGAPQKALSQNQTLEGHSGAVVCANWNTVHNKLTTSDEAGLIIVWTLHEGAWCEEMINNRNKGVPQDLRWAADGSKICIAYDDGAVIVGGVDGARLWGKDLPLRSLSRLHWAPDGASILFATAAGECHSYDSTGNPIFKLQLYCNEGYAGACRVVAIEWHNARAGHAEPGAPVLAVCLDNGRMQLMRHAHDDDAVCVDTGIHPTTCKWSPSGSMLAVAGYQAAPDGRQLWLVQFYSPSGEHLRTMRVPGGSISGLAWEGGGARLALAVGGHVFFASVRQPHLWASFAGTLAYAFSKPERPEHCLVFWNMRSNERTIKYVKRVRHLCAAADLCMLVTKGEGAGEHMLILCNTIGSPVDIKVIELEPKFVALTDSCAVAASDDAVIVWQFRNSYTRQLASEPAAAAGAAGPAPQAAAGDSSSSAAAKLARGGREKMLHIDAPGSPLVPEQYKLGAHAAGTADPIAAITAWQHLLLVARSSGAVLAFSLPGLTLDSQQVLRCRPQRLLVNCDASRLAVVDFAGVLSVLDLAAAGPGAGGGLLKGAQLASERKDVWDVCWASDNPELLAVMEKGRLVVLRGGEAEAPVSSSAWLAAFRELQVDAVALDAVMQRPEAPGLDTLTHHETRSLRDTRALLAAGQDAEAQACIAEAPHPRLWRLLAEHALERLDLPAAEKGFVHCRDYAGVQLVRRLTQLADRDKQQAEVHAYFQRFDQAEALYRAMDRLDLAVALRSRLSDWFGVERLLTEPGSSSSSRGGAGGDDAAVADAWARIGAYYSDRHKWAKAAHYYTRACKTELLVECCFQLEDFEALAKLTNVLAEGQPLLADIGRRLASVGLCSEAVAAFTGFGDTRAAIDCCVRLHQWDQALELAAACNFTEAEGLLQQYAQHLLGKRQYLEAVELYRKAQRHAEAAKLLVDTAVQLAASRGPPLQIKQLYVLAALEAEAHRRKQLAGGGGGAGGAGGGGGAQAAGAAETLAGLMSLNACRSGQQQHKGGMLEGGNAWRGAEAYHFWLLAHQQLYAGQVEAALRTALQLRRFTDILDPVDVWSLLALTGFYSGFYGTCSKALVKLEALPALPRERREAYADLAMAIFQQHPPADPHTLAEAREQQQQQQQAKGRGAPGGAAAASGHDATSPPSDWEHVCVASGRSLRDEPRQRCGTCRHAMSVAELGARQVCPLCHSRLLGAGGRGLHHAAMAGSSRKASLSGSVVGRGLEGPESSTISSVSSVSTTRRVRTTLPAC